MKPKSADSVTVYGWLHHTVFRSLLPIFKYGSSLGWLEYSRLTMNQFSIYVGIHQNSIDNIA